MVIFKCATLSRSHRDLVAGLHDCYRVQKFSCLISQGIRSWDDDHPLHLPRKIVVRKLFCLLCIFWLGMLRPCDPTVSGELETRPWRRHIGARLGMWCQNIDAPYDDRAFFPGCRLTALTTTAVKIRGRVWLTQQHPTMQTPKQ